MINLAKEVVIFSTADWENPFWTNKQHVAVELAKLGYKVFYIDSVGLRRPSLSTQDGKRIWKKIKKSFRSPFKVRENLWVWSPLALPLQSNHLARKFNRLWLNTWLRFFLNRYDFEGNLLWTYNPLTTRLLSLKNFDKVIYHCVDAIEEQPGMPVELLKEAEKELVMRAEAVFTTSLELSKTRGQWNKNTHYFSNVADFDHFSKAMSKETTIPADLADIPSPRLGFVGAISGYKVDFSLLRHVASTHPEWSLVLIGKVGEGDPWTDVALLKELKNVYLIGPRDYTELPAYLKGIDVAIQPNMLNNYTLSMFPMKFFEYLAAGKPIVSVKLDSLQEFAGIVSLTENQDEFVTGIEDALAGRCAPLEKRLQVASDYTYTSRMKKMLNIVDAKSGIDNIDK